MYTITIREQVVTHYKYEVDCEDEVTARAKALELYQQGVHTKDDKHFLTRQTFGKSYSIAEVEYHKESDI